MIKLTEADILDLWLTIKPCEERIAARFATNIITADDIIFNAQIGVAMAGAIAKIKDGSVRNVNYKGYLYQTGVNAAKSYLYKRKAEKNATFDIDGVAKADGDGYLTYDISDTTTDAEEIAIAKITIAESKRATKPAKTARKDSLTIHIERAINMNLTTKNQVIGYLNDEGVAFSTPATVAAIMSKIKRENGTVAKHKNAKAKADRLFADNPQISRNEFIEKMGGLCAYRSKTAYYAKLRNRQRAV